MAHISPWSHRVRSDPSSQFNPIWVYCGSNPLSSTFKYLMVNQARLSWICFSLWFLPFLQLVNLALILKILLNINYIQMWWKIIDDCCLQYLNDVFGIKLIFLRSKSYVAIFSICMGIRSSVCDVFNNFLLITQQIEVGLVAIKIDYFSP